MATAGDDAAALRELEAVPVRLPIGLDVEWLGVSGYRITCENVSLFVDPYVSRVPLRALLLGRVAMPDVALIDRYISAPGPVAGVLVGPHALRPRDRRPRHRTTLWHEGLRLVVACAAHAPARPR